MYACVKCLLYNGDSHYINVHHFSRPFYEKRISAECNADCLGDEWKVNCSLDLL